MSIPSSPMVSTSLTFQHIQADSSQFINVGVVYPSQESDFGRGHGIVVWEEELELEDSAC